jgi:hypothetical protein
MFVLSDRRNQIALQEHSWRAARPETNRHAGAKTRCAGFYSAQGETQAQEIEEKRISIAQKLLTQIACGNSQAAASDPRLLCEAPGLPFPSARAARCRLGCLQARATGSLLS